MRKNKHIYKSTLKNKIEIVKQALKHITHTSQIYTGTNKQSNQTILIKRHDTNKKITTQEALSPDNTYSVDSGGDSKVIPQLTFEDFIDFHSMYHPSNIFLRRRWPDKTPVFTYLLDEYIQDFPRLPEDRLKADLLCMWTNNLSQIFCLERKACLILSSSLKAKNEERDSNSWNQLWEHKSIPFFFEFINFFYNNLSSYIQ